MDGIIEKEVGQKYVGNAHVNRVAARLAQEFKQEHEYYPSATMLAVLTTVEIGLDSRFCMQSIAFAAEKAISDLK